ncbi:arylsulfatase [Flavobacterium sp. FlaQc-48]|uniref:sulfatase family protein n=1 Tax=Flavobacterium sp. FlaQc-48 TaxID=3374181 RepID=UPI0037576354
MKNINLLSILLIVQFSFAQLTKVKTNYSSLPNIIFIYTDDLGYGDLSSYGATEISTPNIDKLANEGLKFTNGHSSSATCTPSRYALLTGMYPWRKKAKILDGDAPMLIDTLQATLPKILQSKGYHTGIVGKWHLGLGNGRINWNEKINPSPNEIGFDYSFIMAATQDRVPTVYIKNGYVNNLDKNDPIEVNYNKNFDDQPTGLNNPELLKMNWSHGHNNTIVNGISRIGFMKGGRSAIWNDELMSNVFLSEAQNYIRNNKKEPFFLYYAMQQPHVPRTPSLNFVGKSGLGPRGDVILEADWCVGELIKTLEQEALLKNTLIIFSSDNGPVLNDGYYDNAIEKLGNHNPSGLMKGGKYSLFEAGTRIPFITYWKGKIKPGISNALVSQVDLLASITSLIGAQEDNSLDSKNFMETFLGYKKNGRASLIIEAATKIALRKGNWVLIPPYKGAQINKNVNIELGNLNEYQLYNLKSDISQKKNLAKTKTKKLKELISDLELMKDNPLAKIK